MLTDAKALRYDASPNPHIPMPHPFQTTEQEVIAGYRLHYTMSRAKAAWLAAAFVLGVAAYIATGSPYAAGLAGARWAWPCCTSWSATCSFQIGAGASITNRRTCSANISFRGTTRASPSMPRVIWKICAGLTSPRPKRMRRWCCCIGLTTTSACSPGAAFLARRSMRNSARISCPGFSGNAEANRTVQESP